MKSQMSLGKRICKQIEASLCSFDSSILLRNDFNIDVFKGYGKQKFRQVGILQLFAYLKREEIECKQDPQHQNPGH